MHPKHIILDCDTKNEIDDQFAIVYALQSAQLALEGVVSVQNNRVSGDHSVEIYHQEATKLMQLAESTVPCFRGSTRPVTSRLVEKSPGVDFILQKAHELASDLTLIGTGPATDLAQAWLQAPQAIEKLKVVWIGGYLNNQDAYTIEECNFYGDREAAGILMAAPLQLTLIPAFEVTDTLILQTRKFARELLATRQPVNHYLAQLLLEVPERHRIFWDIATLALVRNLGIKTVNQRPACIVQDGRLLFPDTNSHTIQVVEDIDELAILADFKHTLLNG